MKNKKLLGLLSLILIVSISLPFFGCERAPRDELTETETGTDTESYSSESVTESEVGETAPIIPTQSEGTEVVGTESSTTEHVTNSETISETSNDIESDSLVTETGTKDDTDTTDATESLSENETESSFGANTESVSETESTVDELTESAQESFFETESLSETESITETESATETETETGCPHEYKYACSNECTLCGEKRDDPSAHQFGSEDTCVTLTCSDCGFVLEQDHDWKYNSGTATLLSPGSVVMKCTKCGNTDSSDADVLDPALLNMPVVYISDLEGAEIPLTKLQKANGEIVVKYKYVSNNKYGSFECFSEIKVQGASSSGYPKKNYNVKFFRDETLTDKLKVDLGWGTENKYTMKANYVDFSQGRNIVAARLFSQVVQSRDNIAQGLLNAPNYGVIDGFPILVYVNGSFHGIYTMNIPKDDWMFGMEGDEQTREALLMADAWGNYVTLNKPIGDGPLSDYGFEIEHCSTTDTAWVISSFNELIEIINCGDRDRIRSELPQHLDSEAAIDNMIFTFFINAADNVAKNILWATYDGNVWIPSMYDMDGTFGMYWNGQPIDVATESLTPKNTYPYITADARFVIPGSKMYSILCKYYAEQVKTRYIELRNSVFKSQNFKDAFEGFFDLIPEVAYTSDREKWTAVPYPDQNRTNMYLATKEQLKRLDDFFLLLC